MATGDQITDPEILRQLNMGGGRPAAPRVRRAGRGFQPAVASKRLRALRL